MALVSLVLRRSPASPSFHTTCTSLSFTLPLSANPHASRFINLLLTTLFIWPLLHMGYANPFLRRVALRTLVASLVALTTSAVRPPLRLSRTSTDPPQVNILVLTLMHGRQLGWVCLGSCGLDVVINALALFWVTSGGTGTPGSIDAPPEPADAHAGRRLSPSSIEFKAYSVGSHDERAIAGGAEHVYPPVGTPREVRLSFEVPRERGAQTASGGSAGSQVWMSWVRFLSREVDGPKGGEVQVRALCSRRCCSLKICVDQCQQRV